MRSWRDGLDARALYLYPTKALARDQMADVEQLLAAADVQAHGRDALTVAVYDGDTPPQVRQALREHGTLVLTNPQHAASGHPAEPPEVAGAVHRAALRRGRRAAHAVGNLRQPRQQRAAAAAAHLPPLRRRPGVLRCVGDDQQRRRARQAVVRAAGAGRRRRRQSARQEALRVPESQGRVGGVRHARAGERSGAPARRSADRQRVADDPVRAFAQPDRGAAEVPARRPEGEEPRPGPRRRLPRRLPAEPAAQDRARPAQRRHPHRRVDQRARARRRHRQPRRVRDGRLPGHGQPARSSVPAASDGAAEASAVLDGRTVSSAMDQFLLQQPGLSVRRSRARRCQHRSRQSRSS